MKHPLRLGVIFAGAIVLLVALVSVALQLRNVNEALDRKTLRTIAKVVAKGAATKQGSSLPDSPDSQAGGLPATGLSASPSPSPSSGLPFTNAAELEVLTRPERLVGLERRPLDRRRRRESALVQEELVFQSPIRVAYPESNQGRAYVYRHGPLGARPVVLWVPGLYVIDLAFIPIGWFVDEILSRGADVVLYVPPYHLERTPAGFASGDALLATSVPDQLTALAQELAELRGLVAWLRSQRVPTLGAFGGSLGGVMLLRLSTWDDGLDFLTVMMPPLRLDQVLLAPPELAPARARVLAAGISLEALAASYRAFDVTGDQLRLPAARVSILAGTYDQVAPLAPLGAWASRLGITRLQTYARGHALLLLQRRMYADYGRLLREDLTAVVGAESGK